MTSGARCDVTAVGRCMDCERAYCSEHQAKALNNFGGIAQVYQGLCGDCLEARKQAERTAAEAIRKRRQQDIADAKERLPVLVERLRELGMPGAEPRYVQERVERKFRSPKFVQVARPAAIPLPGDLWFKGWRSGDARYDPPVETSGTYPAGITADGEVVPMDAGIGSSLRENQEPEICAAIRLYLQKRGYIPSELRDAPVR